MTALPSLREITLEEIGNGLDEGTFSSLELVNVYLARIKEVDEEFRSVLEINEDAGMIAGELDEERQRMGRRG